MRYISILTMLTFLFIAEISNDIRAENIDKDSYMAKKLTELSDEKIIYEGIIPNGNRISKIVISERREGGRNFQILQKNKSNGRWILIAENNELIPCKTCGGVSVNDPFEGIQVKRNEFVINLSGGSRERWQEQYIFKYQSKHSYWTLSEVKRISVDTHDVSKIKEEKKTIKDFGRIKLSDFKKSDFLN